ncbi:hypothetical protein P3T76_006290 [Phytophthora citrophthora]|uniref:Uncharacterized protein n=1 Tax=Phytophthora citrophthora TaxID=4793 RepID=A0AAD9GPI3_9STRA|nr:hypothetical protein P3T76_006290 [Phytophthora citrophthora]
MRYINDSIHKRPQSLDWDDYFGFAFFIFDRVVVLPQIAMVGFADRHVGVCERAGSQEDSDNHHEEVRKTHGDTGCGVLET